MVVSGKNTLKHDATHSVFLHVWLILSHLLWASWNGVIFSAIKNCEWIIHGYTHLGKKVKWLKSKSQNVYVITYLSAKQFFFCNLAKQKLISRFHLMILIEKTSPVISLVDIFYMKVRKSDQMFERNMPAKSRTMTLTFSSIYLYLCFPPTN